MSIERSAYESARRESVQAAVPGETTLVGPVAAVANQARGSGGLALGLARVTIRSDVSDPNKPGPRIDLRSAEDLVGRKVRKGYSSERT